MNKKVLILLIVFIIIWEVSSHYSQSINYFVSSPMSAINYAISHKHEIFNSTLITLLETIIGFIIAIVASFLLMFICLLYPSIYNMLLPIFVTSQILPIITLAPLFIVIFGMGLLSKIAMVSLMCFFPIFINFSTGVNAVSQSTKDILFVYDASKLFTIFRIITPLSTPYIFAGLKVSTTMAIMGAIVAEFVGARDGLGKNLYLAPKNSQAELMVCSIVLTIFLGWILFSTVEYFESILGKWYKSDHSYLKETSI